jgi:transcription elongation GreA/GreB family factor
VKKFTATDPVNLGALIELELAGEKNFYFLGPRAGGTEVIHDKKEILVITPQSPLGEQLLNQTAGTTLQLKLGKETRAAKILSVC